MPAESNQQQLFNELNRPSGRFRYWLPTRPPSNESSDQFKRADRRFHILLYNIFFWMSQLLTVIINNLSNITDYGKMSFAL